MVRATALQISKDCLPAVAAVATIPAAPATTAAAPAAAAASAAISATAAPAATATAFCLGPRFVDHQVPPAEILPVQGVDGAVGIFVIGDFDEGEPARLPRKTVTDQINARGSNTDLRKPFLKLLFRRGKRKIPNVELLHLSLLLPGTHLRVAERAEEIAFVHGQSEGRATRGARPALERSVAWSG